MSPTGAGAVSAPAAVCEEAIDAALVVHCAHPLNCETALPALAGAALVRNARFYVRNHFSIPRLDAASWRLSVGGLVERSTTFGMRDLRAMPSQTVVATLECAGNGRSRFDPPVAGEQWQLGAVGTAEWTGVPLAALLERCRARGAAREIVFRGADSGGVPGRSWPVCYERSLSLEDARGSDALLAYAMNGEPLPIRHGHPLRLIVPGWFAMASVKWLTEIELIDHAFVGHFQTETYVFERGDSREPMRQQNVRSVITEPTGGERCRPGALRISGLAWSGAAPIAKVEVSVGGQPWSEAALIGDAERYGWRRWQLIAAIEQPGSCILLARATDAAGRTQPARATRNRLGYGNNEIHEIAVQVG
jgi:DMSO/TMAO reductase YedYZ molybdopterin-dependent catalytic subunit